MGTYQLDPAETALLHASCAAAWTSAIGCREVLAEIRALLDGTPCDDEDEGGVVVVSPPRRITRGQG